MADKVDWWQEGVFYQIYPRSFRDTDHDGVGDLRGVIEKLDYLEWLGIDGLWLNPTMPSPNHDWGYDVSDYVSVHPELGTMDDLDELIAEGGRRGIRILLDFVPNHTSTEHEWFKDARTGRDSTHRDWYVWADPKGDGLPPNNWLSTFGGSAWEFDEVSGQHYLHNFLDSQADLNWWNEDVRAAMDEVLRFWYERGIAGFRIDVAHAVIKDKELRDNLPATEEDPPLTQWLGQQNTYNMNQPEVHDVIRRWRRIGDPYDPPKILVGETFVLDVAKVAAYYGRGDELHLAFNFVFTLAPLEPSGLRAIVELTEKLLLPRLGWPVWTGSNHDVLRFPSRWCEGNEDKSRLALMMLMTLRGTPFLYYGDEIGMRNVKLRRADVRDPVGKRFWTNDRGRDPGRTPMQWRAAPGAGFTEPDVTPWLPLGDYEQTNVERQRDDPASMLSLTRTLIDLRRARSDLRRGDYESLTSPEGTWCYRRGQSTFVTLNFLDERVTVPGLDGNVIVSTTPARRGEVEDEGVSLGPWEGAVIEGRTRR
jgi:alpha-glucosidase